MNISGKPIEDPKLLLGLEIYYVNVQPVDNHEQQAFGAGIGTLIQYAAVDSILVRQVEINENNTGVIINKDTDRIRIPFDQSRIDVAAEGTYFDKKEKAAAIAKSILKANLEKADEVINTANRAKELLESAIKLTTAGAEK
jgi:hypothetical protein